MANKSISQLTSAAAVAETDLLATAIVDGGSATGYATRKHTVADVGAHIGTTKTFAGLNTTSKNLVGAANEVLSNFADEYDDTATYAVGDIVVHEGGLYKCITAVSAAESFDSTKWTKGTAADFFGGGGDSGELPQVIAVKTDDSGDNKTTYTTGSFSVKEGDVILCCVMHRSTLTPPNGFTVLKTAYEGQSITVIYKVITTDADETYTITQASTVRLSSYWVQLRGAVISDANMNYRGSGSSSFSISSQNRPYYLFLSNVYTGGAWSVSPSEELLVHSPAGKWLHTLINYGTAWHSTFTLSPPGNQYVTIGVFITAQ